MQNAEPHRQHLKREVARWRAITVILTFRRECDAHTEPVFIPGPAKLLAHRNPDTCLALQWPVPIDPSPIVTPHPSARPHVANRKRRARQSPSCKLFLGS